MEHQRSFVIWLLIFVILSGVFAEADLQPSGKKRHARCYHAPASIEKSGGVHQYGDPLDSDELNLLRNSIETSESVRVPASNEHGYSTPRRQLLMQSRKNIPKDQYSGAQQEIRYAQAMDREAAWGNGVWQATIQQAAAAGAANRGRGRGQQTDGRGGGQQFRGRGRGRF